MVRKPQLWEEVERVIAQVDFEKCKSKASKEPDMIDKSLFTTIEMNAAFYEQLIELDWQESSASNGVTSEEKSIRKTLSLDALEQKREIQEAGQAPIFSYNQTDFVKDRVAIEIQFGKYAFVAYDLFVKHLAFYVKDRYQAGIRRRRRGFGQGF